MGVLIILIAIIVYIIFKPVDDGDGAIEEESTSAMELNIPAEEGSTPMVMTAAYDMTMTVNATGDSVRITFPDFSNFEEVTVPEVAA